MYNNLQKHARQERTILKLEKNIQRCDLIIIDELFNKGLFLSINELRYVVDRWWRDYNHYRPHSSLGYMAPVALCQSSNSATLRLA